MGRSCSSAATDLLLIEMMMAARPELYSEIHNGFSIVTFETKKGFLSSDLQLVKLVEK